MEANEKWVMPEERVNLAFANVTNGKIFTSEQQQWLRLIEAHLIENLTIDPSDFDLVPVFKSGYTGFCGPASKI